MLAFPGAGQVSAAEIQALTKTLRGQKVASLKQSSLIALATAAHLCLEGEAGEHWTGLAKQEQQLKSVVSEGTVLQKTDQHIFYRASLKSDKNILYSLVLYCFMHKGCAPFKY